MQRSFIVVSLFVALAVLAAPTYGDTITFKNGDRLTGEVVGTEDDKTIINVPGIGEIRVETDRIATTGAEAEAAAEAVVEAEAEPDGVEAAVEVLAEETEKSPWSLQVDFGALFSSGNTNKRGINYGILAKRETDSEIFRFRIWGIYTEEDRNRTANEQHLLLRQDVKFDDWYIFGETHFEKDEFENLDLRASLSLGAGYTIEDTEETKMQVETAPTLTYEDYRNDEDSEYKFEWMFGFLGQWQLTKDLTLSQVIRVYPNLSDMPNWRAYSETALETPLADEIFGKLSIINEYNTDVDPDVYRNDFKVLLSIVARF